MRFGKQLASSVDPAFEGKYVPYKHLKKVIKGSEDCTPGGDSQSEIHQAFYDELQIAVSSMDQVIMEVLDMTPGEAELERVAKYAELNAMATSKIIKKYCKKLGCMPQITRAIQKFQQLPGLMRLATLGFPTSMEIMEARLRCEPGPMLATIVGGAVGISPDEEQLLDMGAASMSNPQPPGGDADGGSSVTWTGTEAGPRRAAFRANSSLAFRLGARAALKALLPELAASGCGAVCLVMSASIGLKVVALPLGLVGALLLIVSALLLPGKLAILLQPPPPPPITRSCVWALCSFGQLLEGRPATLGIEVVGAAKGLGPAAQIPPAVAGSPTPTFTHEPRLEQVACPCCMQDFEHSTSLAVVPCGHVFCEACLRSWADLDRASGGTCPVCRRSFEFDAV